LAICRKEYVKEVLREEIGELSALDEEVVESLRRSGHLGLARRYSLTCNNVAAVVER